MSCMTHQHDRRSGYVLVCTRVSRDHVTHKSIDLPITKPCKKKTCPYSQHDGVLLIPMEEA